MSNSTYSKKLPAGHHAVRSTYYELFSGQEENPGYCLFTSLRKIYSDYHVTKLDAEDCDLLEFATAGHAHAELLDAADTERQYIAAPPSAAAMHVDDIDEGDRMFYTGRGSKPSARGNKDSLADQIVDEVMFGLYSFEWNNKAFFAYRYVFRKPFLPVQKKYFVLMPQSVDTAIDGLHSPLTDELIRTVSRWQAAVHEEIYVFDDGTWRKSRALWHSVHQSSWDDVILNPQTKEGLIDDVQGFFASQRLYEQFAVPWKRGVVLHGVPGNGKTLSIKALMSNLYGSVKSGDSSRRPIPSLYVKSLQNCQGPQYAIRSIFRKARKSAPCMLIFEDLDSLVTNKIRSYFLNEVDGLESNTGILMIGSTNHLASLDPAIANRPSRFDRKYHFALPRHSERIAYFDYWRKKLEHNEQAQMPEGMCDLVAEWTSSFSFAYLKELVVSALLIVARGTVRRNEDGQEKEANGKSHDEKYVVVTGRDTSSTEDGKEGKTSTDRSKDEEETVKIPEMNIPEEWSNNALLQALKQQVEVLLREMDNSANASGKKRKRDDEDGSDDEDEEERELARQLMMARAKSQAFNSD